MKLTFRADITYMRHFFSINISMFVVCGLLLLRKIWNYKKWLKHIYYYFYCVVASLHKPFNGSSSSGTSFFSVLIVICSSFLNKIVRNVLSDFLHLLKNSWQWVRSMWHCWQSRFGKLSSLSICKDFNTFRILKSWYAKL